MAFVERISGEMLARLGGVGKGSSSKIGDRGVSTSFDGGGVNLAEGLSRIAAAFSQSSSRLNAPQQVLLRTEAVLASLDTLAEQMIKLADRASSASVSAEERGVVNSSFQRLVRDFRKTLEAANTDGFDFLSKSDLEKLLKSAGINTQQSSRLSQIFAALASDDGQLGYSRVLAEDVAVNTVRTTASGSFAARVSSRGASELKRAVISDFSGDSRLDALFIQGTDNKLRLMLGNADGSFKSPSSIAVAGAQSAIATSDINADGYLDLAVFSDPAGISSGSFQAAVSYFAGSGPKSLSLEDVNGDAKLDVVSLSSLDNSLRLSLGNGDGSFQAPVSYSAGVSAVYSSLADVNADGALDALLASRGDNALYVSLGNADGSFKAAVSYAASTGPGFVIAQDVNADRRADLISLSDTSDVLEISLGNGDGSFKVRKSYYAGDSPQRAAMFDLNSDGLLDIVTSSTLDSKANVLLGNSDGSFKAAVSYSALASANTIAFSDFNSDGLQDVAIGSASLSKVAILLANANGSLKAPLSYSTAGTNTSSLLVYDINGDGQQDLLAASYDAHSISVLAGNGDGSFQAAVSYQTPAGPDTLALGDLNQDGLPDLLSANYLDNSLAVLLGNSASATNPQAQIFFGNGNGSFRAVSSFSTSPVVAAQLVDLNGDFKLDLLTADSTANTFSVYQGNGDGSFKAAISSPTSGAVTDIRYAYFNSDANRDISYLDSAQGLIVRLGNSDGSFLAPSVLGPTNEPSELLSGDVNLDGYADIITSSRNSNTARVFLANSNGSFAAGVSYYAGSRVANLALSDVNDDGYADLLVSDPRSHSLQVLLANHDASGSFLAPTSFYSGDFPGALSLADLNTDSVQDILLSNERSGTISVLLGNSSTDASYLEYARASGSNDPLNQSLQTQSGAALAANSLRKLKKSLEEDLGQVKQLDEEVRGALNFALAGNAAAVSLFSRANIVANADLLAAELVQAIRSNSSDTSLGAHSELDRKLVSELLAT